MRKNREQRLGVVLWWENLSENERLELAKKYLNKTHAKFLSGSQVEYLYDSVHFVYF